MTKLTKSIQFRLSEEDYDKYQTKVMFSGYNAIEYFRSVVLDDNAKIIVKNDPINLLYHLNKIGNSINQLAMSANINYAESKITDSTYRDILNGLLPIENKLNSILTIVLGKSKNDESNT